MQRGAGLRVDAIDEPDRRGFAVGTLPAEVSAFSRPATWWSKAGSPVASRTQRIIANRYLNAL
jgi:uncharacterized protein (UPF0548 family)